VLSWLHVAALPVGYTMTLPLLGYELVPIRVDRLSDVFGTVFHLALFLSQLYAFHVRDRLQQSATLVYAGAAIGATYVGDLLSLFVYWEATAIASVFLVWASRRESATRAGMRYLVVQVGSGVLLLAGTVVRYAATGSLAFGAQTLEEPGSVLIFLAFGIKAAFPLLHNWLQDAYPEATVTGTVFLSAFTTKLAIYALARAFAGTEILIPLGALMTVFPIFYAVIENDLRRVLTYSLNNQLGFMVVGVGLGTAEGLNGAAAHAFAHIIYKALLFMSMGAVLYRTGTIKGSELGGLYRSMPWTTTFCIVGAASISAFPLFSGFVAKAFVMNGVAAGQHTLAFAALLFASAGVFHHSGIKIPYFAFFSHDSGLRVKEAPWHMLAAMGIAAALCIGIGIYPAPLYALLPYPVELEPYTASHVLAQLQLLVFSALAFGVLMRTRIYPPELRATNLDSDWLYRRLAPRAFEGGAAALVRVRAALGAPIERALRRGAAELGRHHAPGGWLGEPWPAGTTAMWAALLLAVYLVLYYV
jgi:multicomponent Na+:H+ antiporter subunit D